VEHPRRRHRRRPRRSALLDRYCAEIGRDPASITRSIVLSGLLRPPGAPGTRSAEAVDAGFGHIVLGLPAPYPADVARWVADEVIPIMWPRPSRR
jgi:hypothetical protein